MKQQYIKKRDAQWNQLEKQDMEEYETLKKNYMKQKKVAAEEELTAK
jgi:hypothetical protein